MMRITLDPPILGEVKAKQALSPSELSDYVVNPYLGCQHGCKYCYVQRYFRPRATEPVPWGDEVYARTNIGQLVRKESQRKRKGRVLLSSMTDPYQPVESHYRITREVIECLAERQFPTSILTKSDLVLRDLDLLAERSEVEVTFSISSLDPDVYGAFEPRAACPEDRINALRQVIESGVRGALFIAPHIPAEKPFRSQYLPIFEAATELGLSEITFDFLNYGSVMKRAIETTYDSRYPQGKLSFLKLVRDRKSYEQEWRNSILDVARRLSVRARFV